MQGRYRLNITRSTPVERSIRVRQLEGLFDLPPSQRASAKWDVNLDLPDDWHIGLIVGPSGSGKSTLAGELFPGCVTQSWPWPERRALIDGFPKGMGIKDITGLLSAVGFSSPPSWLKPFRVLSTGEQFRAHVARTLAELPDLAVIDEFTSVVDRQVARVGCAAVAKAVRRAGSRLVAVTCHYDVLDWLDPDWIYEPHKTKFQRRRLRGRPPIALEIARVPSNLWELFHAHHYLSGDLSAGAVCFAALLESQPVAFAAVLHMPHPVAPCYREHRLVCLPDYQGVGIGSALSEFVGSLFRATGKKYFSRTSNPAFVIHRRRSPLWRVAMTPRWGVPAGNSGHSDYAEDFRGRKRCESLTRLTWSFEYVGPARPAEARLMGLRIPAVPPLFAEKA